MVVTQYLKRHPKSKLKKYLPELRRLSKLPFGDAGRDNTSGLKGYSKAWQKAACKDAEFIQTQLDVGHAMYLKPALKYAASVGIKSNLGKALFYGKWMFVCYLQILFSQTVILYWKLRLSKQIPSSSMDGK